MKKAKKDILDFYFVKNKIAKIPYLFARNHGVIALFEENSKIHIAFDQDNNYEVIKIFMIIKIVL